VMFLFNISPDTIMPTINGPVIDRLEYQNPPPGREI